MKMKNFSLFLLIVFFLGACSTHKRIKNGGAEMSIENTGLSYQNAVVIEEKTETSGVKAEYLWLEKNYPGYRMIQQSLNFYDKKSYDILEIKTADGKTKKIYFDISKFYGKF